MRNPVPVLAVIFFSVLVTTACESVPTVFEFEGTFLNRRENRSDWVRTAEPVVCDFESGTPCVLDFGWYRAPVDYDPGNEAFSMSLRKHGSERRYPRDAPVPVQAMIEGVTLTDPAWSHRGCECAEFQLLRDVYITLKATPAEAR